MSIVRGCATAGAGTPRKTYIAMRDYNNDFFSYTTTVVNHVTIGTLGPVVGASAGNCVKAQFFTRNRT